MPTRRHAARAGASGDDVFPHGSFGVVVDGDADVVSDPSGEFPRENLTAIAADTRHSGAPHVGFLPAEGSERWDRGREERRYSFSSSSTSGSSGTLSESESSGSSSGSTSSNSTSSRSFSSHYRHSNSFDSVGSETDLDDRRRRRRRTKLYRQSNSIANSGDDSPGSPLLPPNFVRDLRTPLEDGQLEESLGSSADWLQVSDNQAFGVGDIDGSFVFHHDAVEDDSGVFVHKSRDLTSVRRHVRRPSTDLGAGLRPADLQHNNARRGSRSSGRSSKASPAVVGGAGSGSGGLLPAIVDSVGSVRSGSTVLFNVRSDSISLTDTGETDITLSDSGDDDDDEPSASRTGSADSDESEHDAGPDSRQGILRWKRDRSKVLGRGGFGNVYLGINLDTGGMFAAKQIRIDEKNPAQSQKVMASYHKEIANMQGLSHPNIVRYMGTQLNARMLYIFMELVPGGSIQTLIGKFGKFSETMIRRFTAQIVNGLRYLHDEGIVHRDLKGANILVDQDGLAKLADFGCSKRLSNLTQQGSGFKSVLGTPYWMAPEVIRGVGHGRSADIWSLGCTVIEMANGVPPWCGEFDNPISAMFHIAHNAEVPPTPQVFQDQPASGGDEFLQQLCFNREPSMRATAAELQEHTFCADVDVSDVYRGNKASSQQKPILPSSSTTVSAPISAPLSILTPPLSSAKSDSELGLGVFATLPRLVLLHIISFVPPVDLACRCSLVSHAFRELCEDDTIWRYKVRRFWGSQVRLGALAVGDMGASGTQPTLAEDTSTLDVQPAHAWQGLFCSLAAHEFGWFGTTVLWPGDHHGSTMIPALSSSGESLSMSSPPAVAKSSSKPLFAMRRSRSSSSVHVDALGLDFTPLASVRERIFKGKGHLKYTTDMALSVDTHFLATSSHDATIKLWDAHKRKLLRTITGHDGRVNSVSFLERGKSTSRSSISESAKDGDIKLLSASEDCTVRLWKISKRHKKYADKGSFIYVHSQSVTAVEPIFFGERIVSGSHDGKVRIWDVESNSQSEDPHSSAGPCLSVIENTGSQNTVIPITGLHAYNHMVATSGKDGIVKLWDLRMEKCTRSFVGHDEPATCVQLDLREGCVISGSTDGSLREWDIGSGACVRSFPGNGTGVTSLQFDSRKIVAAHVDGSVKMWNRFVTGGSRCERSIDSSFGREPHPSDVLPSRVLDLHSNVARFSDTHLFAGAECVSDLEGNKTRSKSHSAPLRMFVLPDPPPWSVDASLGTIGGAYADVRFFPRSALSSASTSFSNSPVPVALGLGGRARASSSSKEATMSGLFSRKKGKKDSKRKDTPVEQ